MSYGSIVLLVVISLTVCSCSLVTAPRPIVQTDPKVSRLRCEYLADPHGIDVVSPRLSWIMESAQQAQKQTAWQVLVASSPDALAADHGDLWDSGIVESDNSLNVEYDGTPLASRTNCFWKVRAWDKDHRPTSWSKPAFWSMGLLHPNDWKANWIELSPAITDANAAAANLDHVNWIWGGPGEGADVSSRYFRRHFDLPNDQIKSAGIVIFGEDDYELWINGLEAIHGEKLERPVALDVAKFLAPGRNVLAVVVHNKKSKTHDCGLVARMRIEFNNGQVVELATDSAWLNSASEDGNWTQPVFDDSQWQPARTTGSFLPTDQHRRWLWEPASCPAVFMRNEFVADLGFRRATAYVSGLGWYELHLNGQKVGDHVLDPVVSEYDQRAYYAAYDVTNLVKSGRNAVGAILGLGRYSSMRLRLQIEIERADGSIRTWRSDDSWKATNAGPILNQSEYDGETYDAGKELNGWDEVGFKDFDWTSVSTVSAPNVEMSAQMVEPIRVTGTIHPIAITSPSAGVFIFDMGQNMVGWCRLHVHGPAGTTVQLRHAETLQPDGNVYVANLRTAKATDQYVLSGRGDETYEPRFTYHGFRFVEVTGYPRVPTLNDLEGRVVNNDLETAGTFACSNDLLNQIHHNVYWGVRGNYNGVPTDCPQRNERLGWLGDRGEECAGEAYLFDISALYQKWVRDMRDGQTAAGSISDTAPGNLHNDGVVWPATYPLAVDMIFDQYANQRCLADHYDAIRKWVEYVNGSVKDGIAQKNTYGDWCVPPESPELVHSKDPLRQTDGKLLSTAYFFHVLKLMSKAAALLNKPDDVLHWNNEADVVRNAFNREFLDASTGKYANGSQTSSVLPLAFGIVPPDSRQKVFDALVGKIQSQNKDHLGTGLVGGQWLMRVLTDNGRGDLAYAIATQKDYPGWGYMISKGATTIWELWNGNTADPSMNSGNHVMLVGDLNIWLHEYVVGIAPDPASPGWKHFLIRPRLTNQLDWARGSYQSPYGGIHCEWKRNGDKLNLSIRVPPNSTATVYVPAASASDVTAPSDAKFLRYENGAAEYDVSSGLFEFSTRAN